MTEGAEEISKEQKRIRHLECELDNLELMYKATKGVRDEFEKENVKLLDKLNLQNQRLNELKKDKEWLDNTNNEQTEVILKLNEQIEKMKCCENCKKERLCRRERITYGLGRCEEWEIKEA